MSKPGSRGRLIRRSITGVVIAAVVVGGAVGVRSLQPEDEVVAPVAVVKEATAERTDLSGNVTLDGTVENNSTLQVLHRIEGATPSTNSSTSSQDPTSGSAPTVQGIAFVQLDAATLTDAPPVTTTAESTTTVVESTTTTATPVDPSTTTATPVGPSTTVPDVGTTSPAPATTVPTETVPAEGTTPSDGCSTGEPTPTGETTTTTSALPADPAATTTTSTTVPCAEQPTTSSTPEGAPSGGFPSGGGGGGGGTGGTGVGGATTENITERVTSLPALGATIELGDVLYSVDGTPVIAMTGTLPAWRELSSSSDDGADIAQLETSLLALGYDADGELVVDNEWDAATTKAVKAWQTGLGLEATGDVELGAVVFLPSTVTVTALDTTVGADVTEQDHILDVSGASQQVVAEVSDDADGTVVPGLTVQVVAETPVEGVVTLMRSVAADDGTITVEAVITPTAAMTRQVDGSAVDVEVDVDGPSDAITVPADALVSKLDGSYQVEVRDESGDHWVVVEIIEVRGSKVAVSGIDDGATVLVPA